MLVNTLIVNWRQRTGTDKAGEPTFTDQTLRAGVPALLVALTARQVASLAAVGLSAEASVFFASRAVVSGPGGIVAGLTIVAGDQIGLAGHLGGEVSWYEVARGVTTDKSAIQHHELAVRSIEDPT